MSADTPIARAAEADRSAAAPAARRGLQAWARQALAPALLLVLLTALSWAYLRAGPLYSERAFSLGAVASLGLDGFYGAETSAEGAAMRWTDGGASIALPAQGPGPHILSIELSAPRPEAPLVPATLSLNGAPLAGLEPGPAPRRYTLLVPAEAVRWGANSLGVDSATFSPGGDERDLGLAVFGLRWRSVEAPWWLPLAQAGAIGWAGAALYALLRRGGIPPAPRLLAVALLVAILISMRHSDPRFVQRLSALAMTCGLGLALTAALPLVRPQPGDGALPWRAWLRLHGPALAGSLALTAAMLWPMLPRLTTEIPGHPGDAYEYLWKLQLFSDYLVGRQQSPTFVPDLLYPEGFELANSEITPANTLLGLPLTWLLGPIPSFNLLNLASYVLSGFFTYLLIHRLGARRLAAFVGAIAFAFTARRFYHLAGHLPLMPTQYLPLALYGLEGLLARRRNWDAYVAAMGLALATWASLYYGTTFTLFMAGYALLRTGLRPFVAWVAAAWRPLVLGAVLLVALVAPFAQPYLQIREQESAMRHALIHLQLHAAQPRDYLVPNTFHPLFGQWAGQFQRNDGGEHVVILGYSVMALAALGLWLARPRRLAVALAVLMAVCFVLTLGPFLYLPGGGSLPLPALFIYEHVPILDGIRVWNRVVFYIVLSLAILVGLALTAPRGRRYYLGAAAAAALLLFELAGVTRFTAPGPRPVDLWLSAQPGQGAVIELPAVLNGTRVYYASFQGRPSSVWYGTFDPPLYVENGEALKSFPSTRAVRLLQRWQTEYILVGEAAMSAEAPGWPARVAGLSELELVYSEGGYRVYRLRPAPQAARPEPGSAFRGATPRTPHAGLGEG